jgi:phospholipid/cholesterol/gamma-HCH transport system substrate-binding protein
MIFEKNKIFEFGFGLITLIAVGIIFAIFFQKYADSNLKKNSAYNFYYATFEDIDGLSVGSDVKIAGVNVGKIDEINIDEHFQALIKIKVLKKYHISSDSMLMVNTVGFLGNKYLKITSGQEQQMMKNGDYFLLTQSSINIENLISFFKK